MYSQIISLIEERLRQSILDGLPIIIEYQKPNDEIVTRHIRYVRYSKDKGDGYIEAECSDAGNKELVFKIDRILHISTLWKKATEEDVADKTGLYMFACVGDNHIEYEQHFYWRGERLWHYFEGVFEHWNGAFRVEPIAYHYVQEPGEGVVFL